MKKLLQKEKQENKQKIQGSSYLRRKGIKENGEGKGEEYREDTRTGSVSKLGGNFPYAFLAMLHNLMPTMDILLYTLNMT